MASPQLDKGYARFANELLDALVRHDFGSAEMKLAIWVGRKTYGFNRGVKTAEIGTNDAATALGVSKSRASYLIARLIERNVLLEEAPPNTIGKRAKRRLGIQKDYDLWKKNPKGAKSSSKEEAAAYMKQAVDGQRNVDGQCPESRPLTVHPVVDSQRPQTLTVNDLNPATGAAPTPRKESFEARMTPTESQPGLFGPTDPPTPKPKGAPKGKRSDAQTFLDEWAVEYRAKYEAEAAIVWAKDCEQVKKILPAVPLKEMRPLMALYFDLADSPGWGTGASVGYFLAAIERLRGEARRRGAGGRIKDAGTLEYEQAMAAIEAKKVASQGDAA